MSAESAVANASCSLADATYAGRIIIAGYANIKTSAEHCWKACK
jgi:hypothetical protein